MFRTLAILILFTNFRAFAQVLPKEGGMLSYRIIGFSVPEEKKAGQYKFDIANGNFVSEDPFEKKIIVSGLSDSNSAILEVPSFGREYTWRVSYINKNKVKKSPLFHFTVLYSRRTDTAFNRLRILHPAESCKDCYVMSESNQTVYDMRGNPVWCVPDADVIAKETVDMKFTSGGTITSLNSSAAFELDYNGNIVWVSSKFDKAPGYGQKEIYKHEFVKLPNGHHMLIQAENITCWARDTGNGPYISQNPVPEAATLKAPGGMGHQGRFGTIIEFDDSGKICWTWRSSDYLLRSDYVFYMPKDSELKFDPHDNAFFFDEKNKVIYFGFRNLSRIIKIGYPSGKVLNYYGVTFSREHPTSYNGMYCNQHSIYSTGDGYLYIFNNNTCHDTDALPTVVELKEPDTGHVLEKVWEYVCPIEISIPKWGFHYGGIAKELPDKSVFICMGSDYPKLMIVNHDKQTLWSSIPETYDPTERVWKAAQKVYRGDIIDRKDFEKLIGSSIHP